MPHGHPEGQSDQRRNGAPTTPSPCEFDACAICGEGIAPNQSRCTVKGFEGIDFHADCVDTEGASYAVQIAKGEAPAHPEHVLSAMWARVNRLPDAGEGSAFHMASDAAWEIADDYRRASEGDADVIAEYDDGFDTFDAIMAVCLRNAAKVQASTDERQANGPIAAVLAGEPIGNPLGELPYASELATLGSTVASRYPDDDDAQRVAEYAAQVQREHDRPMVTLPARDAAKVARYVAAFRKAERTGTADDLLNAACKLGCLMENVVHGEDWHKLGGTA